MASRRASAPASLFPVRLDRLFASTRFQALAARLPIGQAFARRDGADIFDVLQGFVASQVLSALVELGLLRRLLDEPARAQQLAIALSVPVDRLEVLLRAAVALRLLKQRRDGRFALARRGAAIVGVPGLEAMIAHNAAFYADMADPAALMRGDGETHLQHFWPYVLNAGDDVGQGEAERYSRLMADSQRLVAQDTLAQVSLKGRARLMDVGGGSGAFMAQALSTGPHLQGALLDLPQVMPVAEARLSESGLSQRVTLWPQSFRDQPLPMGADAISLVRVLYDHDDDTVAVLIARAFEALPPGGLLIVSEPMPSGPRPTDVYFAFYTMAMGSGRVRSESRIAEMCQAAGFANVVTPRSRRPYVTSVLTCVKPG